MKNFLIFLSLLLVSITVNAVDIIPLPKKMKLNQENFLLKEQSRIIYANGLKTQAHLLEKALSPATGWDFDMLEGNKCKKGDICLDINQELDINDEGYLLSVTKKQIKIVGKTSKGVFYGIQTLLQLFPEQIYSELRKKDQEWIVQGVEIEDEPEYQWRGMMLDVSRYFLEKEYVLHFIDMMSMYKMNILHMHLIDDAGWRIEIKKYPKLTSVGAFRGDDEERFGGYYTQDDIKEMVAYAAARNIEMIPEIEIPAHTLAAIAAYPELSCTGKKQIVQTQHSISRELYCVGKESTFDFLADVFQEVFELFPSKYVHIGGDEAKYDRWKKCPHCQKLKNELGFSEEKQLQVHFNRRVQKMVAKYGKTIIGWDEIIEEGLTQKVVGMVWHDKKKAISGVKAGHDMVMAFTDHCYFDVAESRIPGEVKAATWLPPISLKQTYAFNPMIKGLDKTYRKQVLGGHACLWTDQFIHGYKLPRIENINENRAEKYIDYLSLPRMSALSETLWTSIQKRDWDDYQKRMKTHYTRYDYADYGYRLPLPKLVSKEKVEGGYKIVLENMVKGAHITYTTGDTRVNTYSNRYEKPFVVKNLTDFQAMTVLNRRQFSLPLYIPMDLKKYKKFGKKVGQWKPKHIQNEDTSILDINVTGKVTKNGDFQLSFIHIGGEDDLQIQSIEVFKNGKKITENIRNGLTGSVTKNNSYKFHVDCYETGAAFTVKAKVKGSNGSDSKGLIFMK